MRDKLNSKHRRFIKAKINGANNTEAIYLAGYNPKNDKVASVMGAKLLRKQLVQEALDKAGLTDRALARNLKTSIDTGIGIKSTNSDAISGIRLAYELKGALQKDAPDNMTQNNVYINELKGLDDAGLAQKVAELTEAVKQLTPQG
jgi:phage terminase small subunit